MKQLGKHWKGIFIRGIIAICFGLLAMFVPGLALPLLVLLFGVFAFIDGVIAFIVGLFSRSWGFAFGGIVSALVGLFMLFDTTQAIELFLIIIGLWALVTGFFQIIAAIELRKVIDDEIWLLLAGIISVLFGILVFVNPIISEIAISFVIGIYAVLFGIFLMALAMTVKSYTPRRRK